MGPFFASCPAMLFRTVPSRAAMAVLRIEIRVEQQELANRLGLKQSRVGAYETGKSRPVYAVLLRLAHYFHVTLDYLTGRTDSPEVILTEEESRILLLLRSLSPNERSALLRLLEAMAKR